MFDLPKLTNALGRIQFLQGRLHGQMEQLTPELRKQAIINALSAETQASCDIEAAHFDQLEIESAVARSLKIRIPDMVPSGGMAKGAAEMVVQAAAKHDKKLVRNSYASGTHCFIQARKALPLAHGETIRWT